MAAIIIKNNNVLIAKRNKGKFVDQWEFPGGKVELNETLEHALIREIDEELNISISIKKYFMKVIFDDQDFHFIMHCFICNTQNDDCVLKEHSAIKWLDLNNNLPKDLNFLPADVTVVEALFKHM